MSTEIVTTKEVLSRCWKVTIDIQIPSMVLVIDRQRDGVRKKTESLEVMADKVFLRRRQAVRKILVANGTAFDGGYLVPDDRIEDVIKEITGIAREFLAEIPGFVQEWPRAVDRLCMEMPEDADKIRKADQRAGGVVGLAKGLQFRLSKYRVNPDDDIPVDLSGIDAEVRGLAGQIAHEVSQEAKHGSPSMTGSVKSWKDWLAKMTSKIDALAFINPNLESLVHVVKEHVLPNLVGDEKGKVDEATGFIIGGVMSVLRDPNKMLSEGAPIGIKRKVDDHTGAVKSQDFAFDFDDSFTVVTDESAVAVVEDVAPQVVADKVEVDQDDFSEFLPVDDADAPASESAKADSVEIPDFGEVNLSW